MRWPIRESSLSLIAASEIGIENPPHEKHYTSFSQKSQYYITRFSNVQPFYKHR